MALLPDAALLYTGAAPPAALARKRDPMRPSLQILFLPPPPSRAVRSPCPSGAVSYFIYLPPAHTVTVSGEAERDPVHPFSRSRTPPSPSLPARGGGG